MKFTTDEIADTIKDAKLSDSLKKKLIVEVTAARAKMSNVDFNDFFEKIKEKIDETERMLN